MASKQIESIFTCPNRWFSVKWTGHIFSDHFIQLETEGSTRLVFNIYTYNYFVEVQVLHFF